MYTGILLYLLLITCLAVNGVQACNDGEKTRAPFSCREYDECINGKLVRKKCNIGKYFNGQQCDDLWKVTCTVDNCEDGLSYPRGICKQDYDYCYDGKVRIQNCPGNSVFNGKDCVTMKTCRKAKKTTDKTVLVNADTFCEEGKTINHPSDCTMYRLCKNGQWVDKSCDVFEHYDSVTNKCKFWSYTCHYGGPCENENETKNVYGRCSEYMKCVKGNWEKMHCKNGTYFQDGSCEKNPCPLRPVLNKCGYFEEPGSNKHYECPSQQLFDSIERQCVPTQDARCFEGECLDEDSTSVAGDCTKYKLCENGKWVEKSCIWLAHYDIITKECKYMGYTCGHGQSATEPISATSSPAKEKCDKENEKRGVKDDCERFQVCKNGEWVDDKCNVWGKFDIIEKECFYFKMWKVNCA